MEKELSFEEFTKKINESEIWIFNRKEYQKYGKDKIKSRILKIKEV